MFVEVAWSVVNDVLDVLQQFSEVVEVRPVQIVVQPNDDGRHVPDSIAIKVVGGVSVLVAVVGRVQVVGVPHHPGEGATEVFHQGIDAVLVRDGVGTATGEIAVETHWDA